MMVFALRPLEDEMLSHNWARMAIRTRLPVSTLTTVVLGRKWRPAFFQAGHIEQTADMLQMDPVDLLLRHTVFGYATAFMQTDAYNAVLKNALSVGVDAKGHGGLTQNVSDHTEFRRYCRQCAAEELAAYGISYWRRTHNLPGVMVCLKHHTALFEARDLPTRGRLTWTEKQPHEANGTRLEIVNPMRRRFLNKLAKLSVDALERKHGGGSDASPAWYRQELVRRRLLSPDRQMNGDAFIGLVRRQMAGPVPAAIKRDARTSEDLSWLQLMVRPGQVIPFIPLKHLILQAALELSGGEVEFSLDFSPKGYQGKDKARIDARCSIALAVAIDQALDAGEKLSIVQALRDVGCWQPYRHDPTSLPLVSQQVLRLRTSAASLRKTTQRRLMRLARERQAAKEIQ